MIHDRLALPTSIICQRHVIFIVNLHRTNQIQKIKHLTIFLHQFYRFINFINCIIISNEQKSICLPRLQKQNNDKPRLSSAFRPARFRPTRHLILSGLQFSGGHLVLLDNVNGCAPTRAGITIERIHNCLADTFE